jgi:hypothetical protein
MKVGPKILEMLINREIVHDYCDDYGEPGYSKDNENGFIIFGNMWCQDKNCSYTETYPDGRKKLHTVEFHYPHLMKQMEEQGIEFQRYDEWLVDGNGSKAYRTTSDSYHWQSSILWTNGDYLTPEDDISDWVDEVVNNPRRCLPSHVWSDAQLNELGFEEYKCGFENGWHEGMNDDPVKITEMINNDPYLEKPVDILFKLSEASQFYIRFCVMIREKNKETEDA